MGTTINGAGSSQSQSATKGMLSIQNTSNAQARMTAVQMTARKSESKTKKQLNYNHREISGQLVRTKKSQNAAAVLTRAKRRLATLQRQAGSGQYDSKEIANAMAHARRMVRCAQLKMRNLREEEQEQKAHGKENGAQRIQKEGEVKRRAAQKERELKRKLAAEEMQELSIEKRKCSDMAQKRRIHRSEEQSRISEADLKYLKGLAENSSGKTGYSSQVQGAVLDLSMEAAAMAEMRMLEAQIQQEAELEVEAELAVSMSFETAVTDSGVMAGGAVTADGGADVSAAVEM